MPESNFDVDTLGKLTLKYFEKDASSSESSSSSSPQSSDCFESPISSPDQMDSHQMSFFDSSTSEEELPEKALPRKGKAKRGLGVKETVLKRNERERKRVKLISEGFSALRSHVLVQPNNRKLPKLEILRRAIHYIDSLQRMLDESDMQIKVEKQRQKPEEGSHTQAQHTQIRYTCCPESDSTNLHQCYSPEFGPYHDSSNQLSPEIPRLPGYRQ